MIDNLILKAKNIFLSEKDQELRNKTNLKHKNSSDFIIRNLEEITSKYYISNVYMLEEIIENNQLKYFQFEETDYDITDTIKKSFVQNLGQLVLVSEEDKVAINKKFLFKSNLKWNWRNSEALTSAPDFLYQVDDTAYWVDLIEIRSAEKEEEHTKYLEILYSALYNASKIEIDADFSSYGSTPNEKWYKLEHFRLDRNSLFIVIKDEDNNLLSHEFKNIDHIHYNDLQDRLKFWLYMFEGTYRFFIPFDKSTLKNNSIIMDPKIYLI